MLDTVADSFEEAGINGTGDAIADADTTVDGLADASTISDAIANGDAVEDADVTTDTNADVDTPYIFNGMCITACTCNGAPIRNEINVSIGVNEHVLLSVAHLASGTVCATLSVSATVPAIVSVIESVSF